MTNMGYTAEQRDKLKTPLCGAMTKRGVRCRAFAGQGTDHLGVGTCKYHGGATPAAKKHAIDLEAKARLVKLGQPLTHTSAPEALDGLLRATAGHVAWLQQEIMEMEDLGTAEAAVLLRMYDTERDRLTRITEVALKNGLDEAKVRMEKSRADLLVRRIKDAAKIAGLSKAQLELFGAALRKSLAENTINDDPDEAARSLADADNRVEELRSGIEAGKERSRVADERRIAEEAERRAAKLAGLVPASEMMLDAPAPEPEPELPRYRVVFFKGRERVEQEFAAESEADAKDRAGRLTPGGTNAVATVELVAEAA
jgi:hypothetical protein